MYTVYITNMTIYIYNSGKVILLIMYVHMYIPYCIPLIYRNYLWFALDYTLIIVSVIMIVLQLFQIPFIPMTGVIVYFTWGMLSIVYILYKKKNNELIYHKTH